MEEGHCEGEVEGEGEAEVGTEMEGKGEGEAEAEVQAQVGTKMEEGESDVGKQIEHVKDGELEDVEENEIEDDHEVEDEAGEDGQHEEVGDDGEDEDVDESKGNVREEQPCSPVGESSRKIDNDSMHDVRGLFDIEWVSDELDSGSDSEEEDDSIKRTLFPTFSMPKSLTDYKWEVGTAGAKSWQLRKVIDDHSYSTFCNVKLMTSKWLSQRMKKSVRKNPNMKVMDIRDKLSRKWNVGISRNMAFRARAMAKDNIEGSFKEQYRRIYDYGHELLRANPGSTVKIKVENSNEECIFNRIYVCLKACKDSFISCRPIIGLDGCFLKGKYGGELLTAVGRDGNEQILPIAYAVVEVENKDSWTWFLELFIANLGGEAVCGACTFISDQQKGLLPAIQDLLPGVDQRFCVRHLYSNFRKKFPGKDLKRLMWRATTTTYPQL
ncbi:uncharacterized protein LOC108327195 [Vigna angularis]|uniref:uncharacterized protein LOC108327195 n=1 Tax=Phaseolus angularis TaxID=3914 RepID=UPI00080A3D9A|nr:uncharacterized protein LOC108327195 [Vigna angularis]